MENIIEPTEKFNFTTLNLESPSPLPGGNFFTKINYTDKKLPLYIQLPKCKSKHGIIKNVSSNKSYIDLMFNYFETDLLTWFENLETKCIELIHNKKDIWFQTELNLDDIENMFNSAMKSYKSGKYLIIRAHIPQGKQVKKDYCMIFDEMEQLLDASAVKENIEIIPLICINGIKFSSKSFQLDINLPQIMVMSIQQEIKNECMIKSLTFSKNKDKDKDKDIDILEKAESLDINTNFNKKINIESKNFPDSNEINDTSNSSDLNKINEINEVNNTSELNNLGDLNDNSNLNEENENLKELDINSILQEVEIDVENNDDNVCLKKPNDIYYEIYKSAKNKARHLKKVAIDAYLEAKNIKTKYMLDEINSSDDELSNFSENEE